MPTQVIMPQLGESVVEGTLSKWLKKEGDTVQEYEPLMEVNTDKVDTEIPAPANGVLLKVLIAEGTVVKAGTLVALIGQPGESATGVVTPTPATVTGSKGGNGAAHHPAPSASTPMPASIPAPKRELGFISPVVAKIADEYQIDLHQVKGTGQGGRITKKDVLDYVEQRKSAPTTPAPVMPAPIASPVPTVVAPTAVAPTPSIANLQASNLSDFIPVVGMRKSIADHMVKSKHTSPHVTTVFEVDISRIAAHRAANKAQFERDGVNLTFTAYFVAATAAALKAHPVVNSSFADDKILLRREINIGMAVALEEGLIVPVIKNADDKSLLGVARTVNDLANRARAKALRPDEVQGGTFTITNHGVSGSLFATPIINQPQCGILGVGAIQKRVVVVTVPGVGDTIAIRPMCYISLTFDHRILDGASADNFVAKIKATLEGWA